ncbi:MAG: NAD(P)H-dependent oxidoreductase [Bacteroidota bacterium]
MSNYLESLRWRYATKKYDPTKKISTEDFQTIKESIQLAASSYGLQPYRVLIIENEATREKLKPASWGQTQITDASHLFVFCTINDPIPQIVDDYAARKIEVHDLEADAMDQYAGFVKGKLGEFSGATIAGWTRAQAYIALGNLLSACAELRVDATPMEGFEPDKYDDILGLKEKGLTAVVVAAVGYRHAEDKAQHAKKVRKTEEALFETI